MTTFNYGTAYNIWYSLTIQGGVYVKLKYIHIGMFLVNDINDNVWFVPWSTERWV